MRLLTALAALMLVSCSHAHGPSRPDTQRYDEIVVVGTNDFHGYLRPAEGKVGDSTVIQGGAAWFAGYVDALSKHYGDRLVMLDAGDMYQGTIDSNPFFGKSVEEYYNLLPYRALALGNHEFDYGVGHAEPRKEASVDKKEKDTLAVLKQRMRESAHPFVQANIYDRRSGQLWREKNLFPSVLVDAGGYKVGIIGLTTTNTPGTTLPENVASLEFRDFAAPALAESQRLRAQGADLVLITTHEGDGTKPGDPIERLLGALPPGTIDGVVAGHTHTEAHLLVHGVPVIESRTRGTGFGRIDFFLDKQTRKLVPALTQVHPMQNICGTWFHAEDSCDAKAAREAIAAGRAQLADYLPLRAPTYEGEPIHPSAAVEATLAPYLAQSDAKRHEVLGMARADFTRYPTGENQVGTLILDSFHDRFGQAKVIVMNGGGIRRMLTKGPITYGDLYEVSPFDNVAVLVRMTGRQLKELLKVGTSGTHGIPMVWGVKVTYYNRVDPAFARDVNGDGKMDKWEQDRLKSVVWEKTGKAVKDSEKFWVATIDYLAAGGDNTTHVFREIPLKDRKYFDEGPRDLMADYLRKHPGIQLPRVDTLRFTAIDGPGADKLYEH